MRAVKLTPARRAALFALGGGMFGTWWYINPYPVLGIVVGAVTALVIFGMLYTGRIERYRRLIFIAFTVVITLSLIGLVCLWGSGQFVQWAERFNTWYYFPRTSSVGTINFPHPVVLPAIFWGGAEFLTAYNTWQTPVPGSLMGALVFLFPYIIIFVVFGRAFCGWICPMGGLPEAFSSGRRGFALLDRLKVRVDTEDGYYYRGFYPRLNWLRYGLLAVTVALSLYAGFALLNMFYPVAWLRVPGLFPAALIILGVTAVALPVLLKKRLWCLFCPAGTALGLVDRFSPFKLRINHNRCVKCYDCVSGCRMEALSVTDVAKGRPSDGMCIKCGRCIESCSQDAIDINYMESRKSVRGAFITLAVAAALALYVWYGVLLVSMAGRIEYMRWPF